MPKFLFWNLNGNNVPGLLCRMAREELIGVFILAECGSKPWQLLEALNAERAEYQIGWSNCDRLLFLTRFNPRWLTPLFESSHIVQDLRSARTPLPSLGRQQFITAPLKFH